MKLLRAIFLVVLALAAGVLAVRLRGGVETDLYGLADARQGGVLGEIARGMSGQGRVLIEGPDFEAVRRQAERVAVMFGGRTAPDFRETLRALDARKSGLLAPQTRALLLAGRFREVADGALARLFSPVPPLFSVKGDPFLLATDYATSLQTGLAGDWTLRDGYPVCERDGRFFLLLTFDLSRRRPGELAYLVSQRLFPRDGTKIWCGGAPFHSAVASDRSRREIGVLTCASLACVLLLGCLLFRSLRFLPALLFAQGAGFLVAAAALFLAFPKPHVLTFVFGTSLIGLSVDYVYHARAAGDVRRVLKPLTLSLLTTVACFAPLLFADVVVLRQMSLFSIAGLVASYAAVVLMPAGRPLRDFGEPAPRGRATGRLWRALLGVGVCVLAAGLWRMRIVTDPAAFYRPDAYLTEGEKRIAELSPGQARRFAFVPGGTLQEALEREEAAGVKGLSAVIPSLKRQRENAGLIARLVAAEGSNYTAKTGLKMPARDGTPGFLDPETLGEGPLKEMVRAMRVAGGLVSPLPDGASVPDGVEVLEPRAALEGLFGRFTSATLRLLAASCAAFVLVLALVFGRRMPRHLAPVAGALVATAGALGWLGIPLTFFTLLCFFVLAGLGIDYVIFSLSENTALARRTVLFAFLTSFAGFGLLAFTAFPVTRSMGVTFAIGLLFAYIFSRAGGRHATQLPGRLPVDGAEGESGGRAGPRCAEAWHEQGEQSAGRWRMQFMWCVYAWCGKGLQKLVTVPVMACIYPFAKPARTALREFYGVLAEGDPSAPRATHLRMFRHMLGFAWSLADKTDACTLKKDLPAMAVRDDAGWRAFRDLLAAGRGAFLVSTHVGTIEVLPALPSVLARSTPAPITQQSNNRTIEQSEQSNSFPVPHVHAFQQMGHDAVFTKMFMKRFDATKLTLHAVEDIGVETAVRMQEAIGRGELVLMAGDRVSAGSGKTLAHDFLGRPCRWPKGVFAFAKLMESPVFFVTCVRTGWNAYEARFRLFDCSDCSDCSIVRLVAASDCPTGAGGPPRQTVLGRMLDRYVAFLEEEVREHPEQWYQFYRFFG